MTHHNSILIISTLLMLGLSTSSLAQEADTLSQPRQISLGVGFPESSAPLISRLGLGIGAVPDYEGAEEYSGVGVPLIDINKAGRFYIYSGDINPNHGSAGAGLTLLHFSYKGAEQKSQLIFGPLVRAYQGRDESDSDALTGMGNIDPSAGLGLFLKFKTGHWVVNLSTTPRELSNDKDSENELDGLLTTLDLSYQSIFSKQFLLTTELSASWADDDYMQGYFGVSDAQAIRTAYAQFTPEAGLKDMGLSFNLSYEFSQHWWLDAQLGYWRLLNDAAESPLVKDIGSADQFRGLIGVMYKF